VYVILVYDISGEQGGEKVLNKVFKICKKYLTHIQNSVFEGELSEVQILKLNKELNEWIRKDLDSVILFKSRSNRWMKKEMWGKNDDATDNFIWLSTYDSVKNRGYRQFSNKRAYKCFMNFKMELYLYYLGDFKKIDKIKLAKWLIYWYNEKQVIISS